MHLVEVLLISSRNGGAGLVFPKACAVPSWQLACLLERLLRCSGQQGGWEKDETVEDAAARETVEEAGVRGRLEVWLAAVVRTQWTADHMVLTAAHGADAHAGLLPLQQQGQLAVWHVLSPRVCNECGRGAGGVA